MKVFLVALLCWAFQLGAQEPQSLIPQAKLIFADDFNRQESDDTQEELGKSWKTNSQKRAQGVKQADLRDGVLYIKMAKEADHGVSVLHTNAFDDGMVTVRFKMLNKKGVKFNFNDPKANKIAHAGHVCSVEVKPDRVVVVDQLTGVFEKSIHAKKKAGASKKEIALLLKGKSKVGKRSLVLNEWHELAIVIKEDLIKVYVNGDKVVEHNSPGYDHKPKDNLAFAVTSEVEIDDLKVYSFD